MNRRAKASIKWVPYNDGGKRKIPLGKTYSTVSWFEGNKDEYPQNAWSLVVDLSKAEKNGNITTAVVHFLFFEAPHQLLFPGNKFELIESKVVAKGIILE